MEIMRPIFKTEMFIYQSKANLDENILFGNITLWPRWHSGKASG